MAAFENGAARRNLSVKPGRLESGRSSRRRRGSRPAGPSQANPHALKEPERALVPVNHEDLEPDKAAPGPAIPYHRLHPQSAEPPPHQAGSR